MSSPTSQMPSWNDVAEGASLERERGRFVGSDSGAGLSASLTAVRAVAVGSGFGSPMTSVRPLLGLNAIIDTPTTVTMMSATTMSDGTQSWLPPASVRTPCRIEGSCRDLPGRPGGHPQGPVGVVLVLHEQHPIGPRLGDGVPVVSFGTPRISLEVLEDMRRVVAVVSDDPRWMWHLWDIPAWRGVVSVTRRVATP